MVKSEIIRQVRQSKISLLAVVALIYAYTSGGLFGLEYMISSCGPGLAFVMIAALPIVWALPMALVSAELSAMYPEDGGVYVWTTKAMGPFVGFLTGWWYALCVLVDTSIYLVMILAYLSSFMGGTEPWVRYMVVVFIVIIIAAINLRGTGAVGVSTIIFSIIVLSPFVVATIMGLGQLQFNPFEPFMAEGQTTQESIAYGLMVGMWMYCGYEAIGSVAEEIEGAYHKIPKALLICLGITTVTYLIPTLVGYSVMGDWASWAPEATEELPEPITYITMGIKIGGTSLGAAFLISAMFSNLTCYNSYIGSGSRVPYAMARDRMFFQSIIKLHRKWGTPHIAIISASVVALILSFSEFSVLLITVMTLYLVATALFLIACPILRIRRPHDPRPFKIPGGVVFICIILIMPLSTIAWALFSQPVQDLLYGIIGLISGPIAYFLFKTFYKGYPGLASDHLASTRQKQEGE